jgi:DNA-binding protein Fis
MLLARPFGVGLEHVQQVLAATPKPQSISSQTHAAYISDLLARVQRGDEEAAHAKMIADMEPELFAQAIQLAQGNQAKAARWLGVTRLKMREKLIQLGLHTARDNSEQEKTP